MAKYTNKAHTSQDTTVAVTDMIQAIHSHNLARIKHCYEQATDTQRTAQLRHCFEAASNHTSNYEHYQNITAHCISQHGLPTGVIAGINTTERVDFFMPALQAASAFNATNHQGNTFLHCLFANPANPLPPFNYIRSLLLFERNESLAEALIVRNHQGFNALEVYLSFNPLPHELPQHELTAWLALCEALRTLNGVNNDNLNKVMAHLSGPNMEGMPGNQHRLTLIASYYQVPVSSLSRMN
ncbi:hypothetical protein CWC22_013885 [Pseudoalteromonas rubra]|uniref:Uncharacterized protein n=1 Tax=Pseudoalteromonas rubra TaxID=43658 RepID=A0A5S3V0I1_9GAMM|nr:hypothetical protein [Pseudoalteromonas rubra]MEC4087543.1 hypothetical protein [Pseudoalteromonas rubra]QPB84022.1 hypothetical protein CWC22_013885 [Pseudoalteromonas rubra]